MCLMRKADTCSTILLRLFEELETDEAGCVCVCVCVRVVPFLFSL
jgi:hypothetical protein